MVDVLPDMLKPRKFPIIVEGFVTYDERTRTNCLMRIRKRIVKYFPALKEPKKIHYRMELCSSFEELKARIKESETTNNLPILLFFYENGKRADNI